MLKSYLKLISITILVLLLESCNHNSDLRITVNDTDDEYKFSAFFEKNRTRDVQRFINKCIKPSRLFSGEDDRLESYTELNDRTKFKVNASPGELEIRVSKHENGPASLQRMKKMCEGVREVLLGK